MGVRIIDGDDGAVLYCSVTMWAFGPVFSGSIEAQEFLDWLGREDPRVFTDTELRGRYHDWLAEKEEEAQADDNPSIGAEYENNV